jgi:hypothetical protein
MNASTNDLCAWVHTQLESGPLISYPFKLDSLPENGIYFFYENGETQNHATSERPRIVRVGTHKDGNFRSRIAEHFLLDERKMLFDAGKPAPHERSIFRKHIGRALLENDPYLEVWDRVFTIRKIQDSYGHLRDIRIEKEIETEVTRILRDTFTFRYIEIPGQKDRMGGEGLERALIGTLAQCTCCTSSPGWLGRHSPKPKISTGHLWLIQHLKAHPLTEQQLRTILECGNDSVQNGPFA